MDGEHQGSRRIERIHTEGDRTISSVPGQRRVEKLRHRQAIGLPDLRYGLLVLLTERHHRHLRTPDVQSQSSLRLFTPPSCPDNASHVIKLVRSASAKESSLDTTPKWLLEDCIDLISPYLMRRRQEARQNQVPVARSPPLVSRPFRSASSSSCVYSLY